MPLMNASASNALVVSTHAHSVRELGPSLTSAGSLIRIFASTQGAIQRQASVDLGRYRHGDCLVLPAVLTNIPDSAPIAVILNASSQVVASYFLSSVDSTNRNFSISVQVSLAFPVGTYSVVYHVSSGGTSLSLLVAYFQVVPGGNAGGDVIFLHALDRPEATFVLAQLNSGRLCVGRNPYIGD
jgi:hypothetical protein